MEIERKFLVDEAPANLPAWPFEDIIQGYLSAPETGNEVRIRRRGTRCTETVKSDGHLARRETEIELTQQQFESLWPATAGRRIEKTRYEVDHDGLTIELDIYGGSLKGLVIAEVEFPSIAASREFRPLPWMGREVTADPRFKARRLVGSPTLRLSDLLGGNRAPVLQPPESG